MRPSFTMRALLLRILACNSSWPTCGGSCDRGRRVSKLGMREGLSGEVNL